MKPTKYPWFAIAGLVLGLGLAACGGDKKTDVAPSADSPALCKSDGDCADGLTCLGGECTDTSAKALYDTDPTNAVTPEKVKREVDQRTQQAVERANEALNAE